MADKMSVKNRMRAGREAAAEEEKSGGQSPARNGEGGWRLRLRPFKPLDQEYLLRWLADERTVELWKSTRFSWPLTGGQLERYYEEFAGDPAAFALTAVDESGVPAGHFSFRNVDFVTNSAHMGFIVVDPEARGRGYGREMVSLALKYAFELLGLKRVTLGVYDCNLAARRCYESVGFVKNDRAHEYREFHGEPWEYYYMVCEKSKKGCGNL